MYGVGYPVLANAIDGKYVLWMLLILMVGKMIGAPPHPQPATA